MKLQMWKQKMRLRERGIRGQAVAQMITGAFNSVPSTMFNENVSLIGLTKIKSRSVITTAGIMIILAGIFPKISAVFTAVPSVCWEELPCLVRSDHFIGNFHAFQTGFLKG